MKNTVILIFNLLIRYMRMIILPAFFRINTNKGCVLKNKDCKIINNI